jgi:hypothetical protein
MGTINYTKRLTIPVSTGSYQSLWELLGSPALYSTETTYSVKSTADIRFTGPVASAADAATAQSNDKGGFIFAGKVPLKLGEIDAKMYWLRSNDATVRQLNVWVQP